MPRSAVCQKCWEHKAIMKLLVWHRFKAVLWAILEGCFYLSTSTRNESLLLWTTPPPQSTASLYWNMIPFLDVSQVLLTSSGQLQQLWLWDDANWFLNNISSPAITNIITDIITIKYVRPCDVKVGGGLWEHDITNFVLIALTRKQFVIYWTSLVPDVDWVYSRDGYWGILVHIVKVSLICSPTERCKKDSSKRHMYVLDLERNSNLFGTALIGGMWSLVTWTYIRWLTFPHYSNLPCCPCVSSVMCNVISCDLRGKDRWRGAPSSQIRTQDVCMMKSFGLQLFISYTYRISAVVTIICLAELIIMEELINKMRKLLSPPATGQSIAKLGTRRIIR